ncbi:MAG: ATP-binding cassette domain-containing protein, partial [candidate division Zixibacteria bacterium]|nr:ATP-binding cassette domain-containing protein [candidate division Zixibacteria bacterium]
VISGHSGSGKTTLLNIIGAIDSVTEGRIHIICMICCLRRRSAN